MWIARDKDNTLHIFKYKPIKDEEDEKWVTPDAVYIECFYVEEWNNTFADIKWEDPEPTEISFILKK